MRGPTTTPLLLGALGVTLLAMGCQVLTGISDYEAVDGLGGGGASPVTTTSRSGPSTGGQGGTGGIEVPAPTVVWRYAGQSGAGSFSRGLGLGVGTSTGSPTVVGAVRGTTATLDGFDATGTRTRSVAFEVLDEVTVQNQVFGVSGGGFDEAAYTTVAKSGNIARAGLFKDAIGQTAVSFDGPSIAASQLDLDDNVSAENLATSSTRAVGVHAFSTDDVVVAANFTGDITVGAMPEGFVGNGLHGIVVRTNSAMTTIPWQVELRVAMAASGDIWIEDYAFEDNTNIVVGRYTGSGNSFQLVSNPSAQTVNLPDTADNGQQVTDVFYAEISATGALLETRGIVRAQNQAFTEVERQGNALFIGGHFVGGLAFGNAGGDVVTTTSERGFVARLEAQDLSSPEVVQFAGDAARISAMAANNENLYVAVDCSGSIDVLIAEGLAYRSNGGSDDLCFFSFDMGTSPPSITSAARFDGDSVRATDMVFDGGDVFIAGTYSGQWDLPDQPRVSNDDALFVLRLTPPN